MSFTDKTPSRCNGACLNWANYPSHTNTHIDDDDWTTQRWERRRTQRQTRNKIPALLDIIIPDHIIARFERTHTHSDYYHDDELDTRRIPSLLDLKIPDYIVDRFEGYQHSRHTHAYNHSTHAHSTHGNPQPQDHTHQYTHNTSDINAIHKITLSDTEASKIRQTLSECAADIDTALRKQRSTTTGQTLHTTIHQAPDNNTATTHTQTFYNRHTEDTANTQQLSTNPDFKPLVKLLNRLTRLHSSRNNWQTLPPKTVATSLKHFSESIKPPVDDSKFHEDINRLTEHYSKSIITTVQLHINHHIQDTVQQAHLLNQTDIDRIWSTVTRQLSRSNNRITASIIDETKSMYNNSNSYMDCDHQTDDIQQTDTRHMSDKSHHTTFTTITEIQSEPMPQRTKRKNLDTSNISTHTQFKILRTDSDEELTTQDANDTDGDVENSNMTYLSEPENSTNHGDTASTPKPPTFPIPKITISTDRPDTPTRLDLSHNTHDARTTDRKLTLSPLATDDDTHVLPILSNSTTHTPGQAYTSTKTFTPSFTPSNNIPTINTNTLHVRTSPTAQHNTSPISFANQQKTEWKINKPLSGQDILVITDSNGKRWIDKPPNWVVYSFSGATIDDTIDLIDKQSPDDDWKLIIICIGTNDVITYHTPHQDVDSKICTLATKCENLSTHVIFVTPPRSKTYHTQQNIEDFHNLQNCAEKYFHSENCIDTENITFAPKQPDDNKHYTRNVARNLINYIQRACTYLK